MAAKQKEAYLQDISKTAQLNKNREPSNSGILSRMVGAFENKHSVKNAESATKKLENQHRHVENKLGEMKNREEALLRKEKDLNSIRKQVEEQKKTIARNTDEYKRMMREKPDAERIIEKSKTVKDDVTRAADKLRQVEMEQLQLESSREDLHRKAEAIEELAKRTSLHSQQVEEKEQEIGRKEKDIEERELSLRVLERACDLAKRDLAETKSQVEANFKGLLDQLPEYEKNFDNKARTVQDMLGKIEVESEHIQEVIEEELQDLSTRQDAYTKASSELQQDRKRLETDEDGILEKIQHLEREQKNLRNMQALIKAKEKHTARTQQEIQKKSQQINAEKAAIERERNKIQKARVTDAEVKQLEKRKMQLQKTVSVAGRRAAKKEATKVEVKLPKGLRPLAKRATKSSDAEAHHAIERAQRAFLDGHLEQAKELSAQAQIAVDGIGDADARRPLEYSLRELQTSIRLGML